MIWFTSDTHFGHANILKHAQRPWDDIDRMNRDIISNINARVMYDDQLWVLGDFSYGITVEEAKALRKQIRCRHVHLVRGNHDKDWSQPEVKGTFIPEQPIAVMKEEGHKLVLSHYPMADWQGMRHGSIHLHGHIHSKGSDYNELNRMQGLLRYDVGMDAHGYCPVSLDEILAWFEGVEHQGCVDWRQWVVSTDNAEAAALARMLWESEQAKREAREGVGAD